MPPAPARLTQAHQPQLIEKVLDHSELAEAILGIAIETEPARSPHAIERVGCDRLTPVHMVIERGEIDRALHPRIAPAGMLYRVGITAIDEAQGEGLQQTGVELRGGRFHAHRALSPATGNRWLFPAESSSSPSAHASIRSPVLRDHRT